MFSKEIDNKIINIINSLNNDDEFEFKFFSDRSNELEYSTYINILDYLIYLNRVKKYEMKKNISLDVLYNNNNITNINNVRISILSINEINNIYNQNQYKQNNKIFELLLNNLNKNVIGIIKDRYKNQYFNIDDYDILVKVANEKKLDDNDIDKINELKINNIDINYRYKERISLILENNKNYILSIDLTRVKSFKNLVDLSNNNIYYKYELELDLTVKDKINNDNIFNLITQESHKMLLYIQQSNILLSNSEKNIVLKSLNKLLYNNENITLVGLPIMNVVSFEKENINMITKNYTITDKLDGERYYIYVKNGNIYLISNNIKVKKINEKINLVNVENTILDGEYIYDKINKKYILYIFDIIYYKGEDVRKKDLNNRFNILLDTINNMYDITNKKIQYKQKGDNDINIKEYIENEIDNYIDVKNKLLNKCTNHLIINKFFIFPLDINNSEIYLYSVIIWQYYNKKNQLKLDGIVYTPINQIYSSNVHDVKNKIYKWKPKDLNSIDFYIKFEKNQNGQMVYIYDKTEIDNDDKYIICNLYVSKKGKNNQYPILFQREKDNHIAHILVNNKGLPKDIENNIIEENSVIEMSYDGNISDKFKRWIPLRTRYDKTDVINKYKIKYGNNEITANKVFNSIIECVDYDDILKLSNYTNIEFNNIVMVDKVETYYQKKENMGKPMREFNNWIKNNLIHIYCRNKDILDIGIGIGGDVNKYYYAKIKSCVGLDIDNNGLYINNDSCLSRYNNLKKKNKDVPSMTFIQCDSRYKYDLDSQILINNNMNENNKKLLVNSFGKDNKDKKYKIFDVINAQFMIHYLFKDEETFNNLCYNINKYLDNDGYIIITTFDGDIVNSLNYIDNKYTSYYTDIDGKNIKFFEIIKLYNEKKLIGSAIDVNIGIFRNDNNYITEYLVYKDYLIKQMKEKCNMRLIESHLFYDIFNYNKNFLINNNNENFKNIKKLYDNNDNESNASIELLKLNRYYVFQKLNKN